MTKSFFSTVLFCVLLIIHSNSNAQDSWLSTTLTDLYNRYSPPSIAAAIVTAEGVTAIDAIGIKKLNTRNKIGINDQYHIGSITKSFTALLAAILVKEGQINWDTKYLDIFPEVKARIHPSFKKSSLKSLLLHRAGIPPFAYESDWNNVPAFKGSVQNQREQFARWVLGNHKNINRGSFQYSNAGYNIAAAMLEKVTGHAWETLVIDKVCQPLDLKSTGS